VPVDPRGSTGRNAGPGLGWRVIGRHDLSKKVEMEPKPPLKLKPGRGLQDSRRFSVLWGYEPKTTLYPRRRCPGRGDLPHHP
jgi:hypothetical protein